MWTCKQVSNALAREDYMKLPPWRRFLLKFHIGWCFLCGKYNGQVVLLQDGVRSFREHEEEAGAADPGLPAEDARAIKDAVHRACSGGGCGSDQP